MYETVGPWIGTFCEILPVEERRGPGGVADTCVNLAGTFVKTFVETSILTLRKVLGKDVVNIFNSTNVESFHGFPQGFSHISFRRYSRGGWGRELLGGSPGRGGFAGGAAGRVWG